MRVIFNAFHGLCCPIPWSHKRNRLQSIENRIQNVELGDIQSEDLHRSRGLMVEGNSERRILATPLYVVITRVVY